MDGHRSRAHGVAAVVAGVLVAAITAGPWAPPAGATLAVTSSGSVVTARLAAHPTTIGIACGPDGTVRIGGASAVPAVACGAVARIRIVGDDGPEQVDLTGAGSAAFPALTGTIVALAGGADRVTASTRPDALELGDGDDTAVLPVHGGPLAQDLVDLGGPNVADVVEVVGRSGPDHLVLSGSHDGGGDTIVEVGSLRASVSPTTLRVGLGGGDDRYEGAAFDGPTHARRTTNDGGPGDDALVDGPTPVTLVGGPGTNVLLGGPGQDIIRSSSKADRIDGGEESDEVWDVGPGPIGRPLLLDRPNDALVIEHDGGVVVRTRGTSSVTATVGLRRSGRVALPPAGVVAHVNVGPAAARSLYDVAPVPGTYQVVRDSGAGDVVDVVVPATASWSYSVDPQRITVSTGVGYVQYPTGTTHAVIRYPFTDPHERFAHRVLRDLEWRIPTAAEREDLRAALATGRETRAQVVTRLTDTATYRDLLVDRAFADVLRRGVDGDGRGYWADRLDAGLVVRRLRANLYGSPEYVAAQGGTEPAYVAAVYRDILGRTATADEVAYWAGVIRGGTARGTVADRFLATPEARLVVIRDHFLRFADRMPTTAEVGRWSAELASSTTDGELSLTRALAASATYHLRPDV